MGIRTQASRITRALELVSDEQEATATERRALGKFRTAVAELECVLAVPDGGLCPPARMERRRRSGQATVLRLYQEFVLDCNEATKDQPLETEFAAEFGDTLTMAIQDGQQLTRPVQQALCEASSRAIAERTWLLDHLHREATALSAAAEVLDSIQMELAAIQQRIGEPRSITNGTDTARQLDVLEGRCQTVLNERQATLHTATRTHRPTGEPLFITEYLYENAPFSHPVLAETLDCIQVLHRLRCSHAWSGRTHADNT